MAKGRFDQRAALPLRHRELENVVVLYATQAMLGLIGPSVEAVAVELRPERLVVHFALGRLTDAERDDIEDVMGDLDALLGNEDLNGEWKLPAHWRVEPELHVGPPDEAWPGCSHRRVFERRPRE